MNDLDKKRQALDFILLGLTVAIASILAPAIFPAEITVSPLVIFGIIFLTNISGILIPEDIPKRKAGIFSLTFFGRLALSTFFAALLIFLSSFAQSL